MATKSLDVSVCKIGWHYHSVTQPERAGSFGTPEVDFFPFRDRFAIDGWVREISPAQAVKIANDWRDKDGQLAKVLHQKMVDYVDSFRDAKRVVKLYKDEETGKPVSITGNQFADLVQDLFGGPNLPTYKPEYRGLTCNRRGDQVLVAMAANAHYKMKQEGGNNLTLKNVEKSFTVPVSLHDDVASLDVERQILWDENNLAGKSNYTFSDNYARFCIEWRKDKSRPLTAIVAKTGIGRNDCLAFQAIEALDSLYPNLKLGERLAMAAPDKLDDGSFLYLKGGYIPPGVFRTYQATNTLIGGDKCPGQSGKKGGTPDEQAVKAMGGAGKYKPRDAASPSQVEAYVRIRMEEGDGTVKPIQWPEVRSAVTRLNGVFPVGHPCRIVHDALKAASEGNLAEFKALTDRAAELEWSYVGKVSEEEDSQEDSQEEESQEGESEAKPPRKGRKTVDAKRAKK